MKLLLTILLFSTKLFSQSVTVFGNLYLSDSTIVCINNQRFIHTQGGGGVSIDGHENLAIGYRAGDSMYLTNGYANTAIGKKTAIRLHGIAPLASSNTVVGFQSFMNATTGSFNTAFGTATLATVDMERLNTAIGYHSMSDAKGEYNTGIGAFTLSYNKSSGSFAGGYKALYYNTTGTFNVAIGFNALQYNTTGTGNTAVGYMALMNNVNTSGLGFGNTAIGKRALYSNTTGYVNFAGGEDAGFSTTTGYANTFIGRYAGYGNVIGIDNLYVGKGANSTGLGSGNVIIGKDIYTSSTTANNELNVAGSIFGVNNYNITTSRLGIGVVTPNISAKLEIQSTTSGFLPPRMTAAQAAAIPSPAEGLIIYVTDTSPTFPTKGWYGCDGMEWQKLNN